jgi:cyclopropane fatty-acyl-phospholipid synthase-like methyltransferase/DUF1365 family protein
VNRLYEVEVFHRRQTPLVHEVRQRNYLAYVDLDALPRFGILARFRASDHIGNPRATIRANIEALLAEQGISLDGGQIMMLSQPRSFGYVFNPLTLFWCHRPSGELAGVVAEVHNTYGQTHAYVVHPDEDGAAETEKRFYVSPFYPVDGFYRMSVPEPGERLAITLTLHRPEGRPFVASMRGLARPLTLVNLLVLAARHPLATYAVRAGIAWHGIRLYLKGLPIVARPISHPISHPSNQPHPEATRTVQRRSAAIIARVYRDVIGADLPVRVQAWDASVAGPAGGPTVVLRSRRALRRIVAQPGELGLARAYVTGELDVDGDLTEGFRQVWSAAENGRPPLTVGRRLRALAAAVRLGAIGPTPRPPSIEARLSGRAHTRGRDRAVIAHHYDLSNEFYELILDPSMAYSAAYFADTGQSLASAQAAKLDLICRKLKLESGMRLLDVGCGWGSLILHAAENYGVHATGVTLSAQQREFVAKRVADRGLADRVSVALRDYRDLDPEQRFDAVASIEMGEHVGLSNYAQYAAALYRAVAPNGRLMLQQMSRRAGSAPGGGPFIEAYIAPDMHMRPLSETVAFLEQSGFEITEVENLRTHYALTARAWSANFDAHYDSLVALVGEQVARVWRLYLVGGALSFEDGRMGVEQILAVRS